MTGQHRQHRDDAEFEFVAGKSGVVGKCPQSRASTGNASDRRSSLIARYPRRFAH
jgi:hypothetical protein